MLRPTQDAINTFMRITGTSESVAVQKLEEFGGNVAAAVNAHFTEVEGHIANQSGVVLPQYVNVERSDERRNGGQQGFLPLLSAARTFKPSLLLDPNYRRNLYTQISSLASPPPRFQRGGEANNVNAASPPYGRPYGPYYGNASSDQQAYPYGGDTEDALIQMAMEASKQEGSSGGGVSQRELQVEDDEFDRALSLSLKTAEEEEAKRQRNIENQKQPERFDNSRRRDYESGNARQKSNPGSSSVHVGVHDDREHLFNGISAMELDEALLLEESFFGKIPERISSQKLNQMQNTPDKSNVQPSSPSLVAQRLLREQQDDEYLASLLADREKEAGTSKDGEACSSKEAESRHKMLESEALPEQIMKAKKASLPQEPGVDDEHAINLLVRMPDGSRIGRRFLKSDKLQCLFDFIDAGGVVKPGTYRVVRPFPKRAFCSNDCSLRLNELGLTNKQEALFLELI